MISMNDMLKTGSDFSEIQISDYPLDVVALEPEAHLAVPPQVILREAASALGNGFLETTKLNISHL